MRGIHFLQDRKGRVHVRFNGVLAQQGRTEGVDGGNAGGGQLFANLPQTLPFWFGQRLGEPVGQPLGDALAHFRRGLLGKRDGQHLAHADVGMLEQQLDIALDERCGLAGAGTGGDRDIALAVEGHALDWRQGDSALHDCKARTRWGSRRQLC